MALTPTEKKRRVVTQKQNTVFPTRSAEVGTAYTVVLCGHLEA